MSDSKRKGGSENLERPPEKALRMEDAPVVIVYDIETLHRHPCDQTPGGIPCFACANYVNVMQTTEIIEFAATVLELADYSESKKIRVTCGKNFDIYRDCECAASRKFSFDNGYVQLCNTSKYVSFSMAWHGEVKEWFDEIFNRCGALRKVVLLAHNGNRYDHFHLLKSIPELKGWRRVLFADPLSGSLYVFRKDSTWVSHAPSMALRELQKRLGVIPGIMNNKMHQAEDDVRILCAALLHKSSDFVKYLKEALKGHSGVESETLLSYTLKKSMTYEELTCVGLKHFKHDGWMTFKDLWDATR
jgi:hypothetical protein